MIIRIDELPEGKNIKKVSFELEFEDGKIEKCTQNCTKNCTQCGTIYSGCNKIDSTEKELDSVQKTNIKSDKETVSIIPVLENKEQRNVYEIPPEMKDIEF